MQCARRHLPQGLEVLHCDAGGEVARIVRQGREAGPRFIDRLLDGKLAFDQLVADFAVHRGGLAGAALVEQQDVPFAPHFLESLGVSRVELDRSLARPSGDGDQRIGLGLETQRGHQRHAQGNRHGVGVGRVQRPDESAAARRYSGIALVHANAAIAQVQVPGVAESLLNDRLIDYLWRTWSPGLEVPKYVREMYADPQLRANALKLYRANFDRSLHDPALTDLAKVSEQPAQIPMLVLAGAEDGCITPDNYADAATGLAPGSRVEIVAGAGHFLQLDRPDEVAALALDWLR